MSQTAMNSRLTYRLHRDEDIPALLRLWEENTDWGQLTDEQWRKWYVNTPHGPCLIPVAVDEAGTIRGQAVFTPARLAFGDEELKVLRISAPILQKQLRAIQRPHPALCLYDVAMEAASAQGYRLFYAYPDQSLAPFFRHIKNVRLLELNSVVCDWNSEGPPIGRELSVTPATRFGDEYQHLWDESRSAFPIAVGITRSPEWLRYRNGGRLALEVRDVRQNLVGYVAFRTRTDLLNDCVARTSEELTDVLSAAIRWLGKQPDRPKLVKAMASPIIWPALEAAGFTPEKFKFLFAYCALDPGLRIEAFDLDSWHLMPGD
jgi:hypothetical protein